MLKNNTKSDDDLCKIAVAPFVGAWIETYKSQGKDVDQFVAPFVGAWIETYSQVGIFDEYIVAPFVGAWIETLHPGNSVPFLQGRSFRRSVD